MSPLSLLLNLLWMIFGGIRMAIGWLIAAMIAMITAAISQPMAIQMPPKIIHNRLSSSDRGDMVVLPLGALLAYLNFAYLNDGGERLLTNPTVIGDVPRI